MLIIPSYTSHYSPPTPYNALIVWLNDIKSLMRNYFLQLNSNKTEVIIFIVFV